MVLLLLLHNMSFNNCVLWQVELCVKILSDIMDLLFRAPPGTTIRDITEIILTLLRTVIQSTIAMDRESQLVVRIYCDFLKVFL